MVQAGRSAAAEAQRDAAKAARRELRKQKTMVKIDEAAQGNPSRANSRNVHGFDGVGLEVLYGEKPPDEVIGPSGKVYRGEAFFCLKTHSKPRVWAISLVESKPFDPFILAVICANCFTLAWQYWRRYSRSSPSSDPCASCASSGGGGEGLARCDAPGNGSAQSAARAGGRLVEVNLAHQPGRERLRCVKYSRH